MVGGQFESAHNHVHCSTSHGDFALVYYTGYKQNIHFYTRNKNIAVKASGKAEDLHYEVQFCFKRIR